MKSEERHRLQESELEKFGRHARAWIEKYGLIAAGAILGVALVVGVTALLIRNSRATEAQRWDRMITADDAAIYGEIADEHPDTTVGRWARLMEAQQALGEGIQLSLTEREGAVIELVAARKGFREVLASEESSPMLRERALFGLAQTLETLAGVDVGEHGEPVLGVQPAIDAYQQLIQDFPNSVYVPDAKDRIAALKSDEVQDFYAWFREQSPSPADRLGPQDPTGPGPSPGPASPFGLPPGHPEVPGMIPGGPPIGGAPGANGPMDLDRFLDERGADTEQPAQAEKPMREDDAPGPTLPPPGGAADTPGDSPDDTPDAPADPDGAAPDAEPAPAGTNP